MFGLTRGEILGLAADVPERLRRSDGGSVRFNVSDGKVTMLGKGNAASNVVPIVQADQTVNNGVVHVIDRVLLPQTPVPQ